MTLCIWAAILAANLDQLGNRHFTFGKRMPKTMAMKAMETVKKPLQKGGKPLQKGQQPLGKGGQPLKKGILKRPSANLSPLRRGNLAKLGQMSLKDKVKKIAEEHEDEVEAAMVLKESMTAAEKTKAWNKYDAHLKKCGNEEEKDEFDNSSRKEKGLKSALFLMRAEAPKFCSVSKQINMEKALTKKEDWLSEREAIEKWGRDDLDKHLESGRVVSRETSTWGVWEYMDNQNYSRKFTGRQLSSWMIAQEFQQHPEEELPWQEQLDKDLMGLISGTSGKGKGKNTSGKGNGDTHNRKKGNGKTPRQPKALEDMTPEEQMHEALGKLKRTRDLLASTSANYEEALNKVRKCGYLTKAALKEKEASLSDLGAALKTVKNHLAKGEDNKLDRLKQVVLDAVKALKDAKEEAKELVQISMRTHSKASKQ